LLLQVLKFDQCGSRLNAIRVVHLPKSSRGCSNLRPPDDQGTLKLEMVIPFLLSWMEEDDDVARIATERGQIWSLVPIAVGASESQVFRRVIVGVLLGLNVFDV
jgi:hypothetical protein